MSFKLKKREEHIDWTDWTFSGLNTFELNRLITARGVNTEYANFYEFNKEFLAIVRKHCGNLADRLASYELDIAVLEYDYKKNQFTGNVIYTTSPEPRTKRLTEPKEIIHELRETAYGNVVGTYDETYANCLYMDTATLIEKLVSENEALRIENETLRNRKEVSA